MQQVKEWVNETNGLEGRFVWLSTFADTNALYRKVLKSLLSIGTVGSINTERSCKGVKHEILSIKRNRLTLDQALTLYRASENLRELMIMKLRISITERVHKCIHDEK